MEKKKKDQFSGKLLCQADVFTGQSDAMAAKQMFSQANQIPWMPDSLAEMQVSIQAGTE